MAVFTAGLCIVPILHAQTQSDSSATYTLSYSSPLGSVETLPEYLRAMRGPNPPKIGLVLSGGGARGIAQIGVLRALDQAHIPLQLIVGTSIGALVGGLYASGYTPAELDSIVHTTDWDDLLVVGDERYRGELSYDQKLEHDRSILTLQLNGLTPIVPDAFSLGQRFGTFINRLVWDAPFHADNGFDDLKIPFRAIATDVAHGKSVIFDRGNLSDVMRASATAPLRFAPIEKDSMILVDGGLLSNIPTSVAKNAGCDLIIVVNTTSPLHASNDLMQAWDVADQVVTVMMRQQYATDLRSADIEITPDIGMHQASDFSNIDTLIARGYTATITRLPALLGMIADRRGITHAAATPQLHFQEQEIAPEDLSLVKASAEQHTPILALFDSLSASGRYGRVSLTVHINGGIGVADLVTTRSPIIRSVHIVPDQHATGLDSIARMLEGSSYDAHTCTPALERMLRWYRTAGYAYGSISGTRYELATGSFEISVIEGQIRSISLTGNQHTKSSVITRELPFSPGQPFRTADGVTALRNLEATNIFRQATLEVIPHSGNVDIGIRVLEQSAQVLRISGRIDNERNAQLGVEVADDNLFGLGMHIGALIFGGLRNRNIQATFSSNRILTTHLSYNATAYADSRDIYTYADSQTTPTGIAVIRRGEYTQQRNGARFSVGENVPRIGLIGVTARYEREVQRQISGDAPTGASTVFSLRGQLVIDTENDFPFPQSGTLVNASYEAGLNLFGSTVAFTKFSVDYDTYVTVDHRHTLHPHVTWGYADETTPTANQFRIGGQETFAGLREDQYLGNQILTGGLEYRLALPFRLFFPTFFTARYDIGTVWPRISEVHFGDLRHGAGAGLSINTPIGPASFEVGRSFTVSNPIDGKSFAVLGPLVLYFTVGSRL